MPILPLRLEPFAPRHFRQLIAWIEDEELLTQFAGPTFTWPLTGEQLKESLTDPLRHSYAVLSGQVHIGHIEWYEQAGEATARILRVLLAHPDYKGNGLCVPLIEAVLAEIKRHPHIKKAMLRVYQHNRAAIRCYQKSGFEIKSSTPGTDFRGQHWPGWLMEKDLAQAMQTQTNTAP